MVWLAVDSDGDEVIFEEEPIRGKKYWGASDRDDPRFFLPKGSIEKLLGKTLAWEDEPVCVE